MKTLNNIISKDILKGSIHSLFENGLPYGLETGIDNLDDIFRFDKGKLCTITGIPNMGKSEFLDFICVQLNKAHGLKTLYYSPENQPLELHFAKLFSKFSNKQFDNSINEKEYNQIVDYITDNFYFMNYDNVYNLDSVLSETEQLVYNKGIDILVIDSYNKLEAQKDFNVTETDYISKILDTLERFAKRLNIIVFLVAHPRKMQKDAGGNYQIPSPYDINGSANFFNKSDYCLTVHRDKEANNTIIKIDKVKFKNYGCQGETRLGYDIESGNYFDIDTNVIDFDNLGLSQNYSYNPYPFTIPEQEYTQTNTIDYLDCKVSYFSNISDTQAKECTLKDMLFNADFIPDSKIKIDRVRNEKDIDRKKVQKGCLANYTISCTFNNSRKSDDIKEINPLMCIDIDKKDNLSVIDKVPSILKGIDNVLYLSKSCSGEGYFCIIPIADTNRFKEHFLSLESDFASMGITIDKACKDITRTRFISYDDNYYYNANAAIYSRFKPLLKESNISITKENKGRTNGVKKGNIKDNPNYNKANEILEDCKRNDIDITDNYSDWLKIGLALISEFGENGKDLYHSFSQLSNKYDKDNVDKQFDELLEQYSDNNEINFSSLVYIYNEYKSK